MLRTSQMRDLLHYLTRIDIKGETKTPFEKQTTKKTETGARK